MIAGRLIRRLFAGRQRLSLLELADGLMSERGEASGVALARELLDAYLAADEAGQLEFLTSLPQKFGIDARRIDRAIASYQANPRADTARRLHEATEPRVQELLRRLNLAPGGTAVLVRMREDVLRLASRHAELRTIDADFSHLFASWFNRGFLELRRIDWSTPAAVLEKIIRYEAVHEINSWAELRGRLEPVDRRCFAFFHPAMPDDPLIFVEVALTEEIPDRIAPLLSESHLPLNPAKARTAVFYSISNCQKGLQGISFGNFLIKQVVEELRRDLPDLRNFVTLSPVPGFAAWLQRDDAANLSDKERQTLARVQQAQWQAGAQGDKALEQVLTRQIAHYLLNTKSANGKPRDPVARFHLNNGARLERINWLADLSVKGLRDGLGFMVNYLYDLDEIEKNHEAFVHDEPIAASRAVKALARPRRGAAQSNGPSAALGQDPDRREDQGAEAGKTQANGNPDARALRR